MAEKRTKKVVGALGISTLIISALAAAGCVQVSGGTWAIRSAATPEGWPKLTPIGEVEVKEYPAYRAAIVEDRHPDGDATRPMFMDLFRHIQRNDIAMTAPVDMGYATDDDGRNRMNSMAFLYRTDSIGTPGEDGSVEVLDVEPSTFASVGMRGGYTTEQFEKGLATVETWMESHSSEWMAIGPPRFLGYNSPFVPPFMRYGEVQIPVERRTNGSGDEMAMLERN